MNRRTPLAFVLLLSIAGWPTASAQARWTPTWGVTSGLAAGVLLSPGEIGRHPNATGAHEDLVARLPDTGGLALSIGIESHLVGVEVRLLFVSAAVEVKNDAGVSFPNHAEPPLFWDASVLFFPLFPLRRTGIGQRMQPVIGGGLGGLLASIDLDNIDGQTIHQTRQRPVAAGIRLLSEGSGLGDTPFVEVRWTRHRVSHRTPLHAFTATAVTLGFGGRF